MSSWLKGINVRQSAAGVVGLSDWKDECAFARIRTVRRDFRSWKKDDVYDSRY